MNHRDVIELAKETGVSVKKILDVGYVIKTTGEEDNRVLITKTGVAKSVIGILREKLMAYEFPDDYCPEEKEWETFEKTDFGDKLKRFEDRIGERPVAQRKYDQFFATNETVVKRGEVMNFFEDINDKKILVLGDDDRTSVAIDNYQKAREIAVLEIDQRIVNAVNKLGIAAAYYDARKPLPEVYKGKYDVVFIDPPYTTAGVKCFLSRAIEVLDKTNLTSRVYMCYGNSDRAKERFLPIYQLLIDSGLYIRRIYDKFNRYVGAESIGSASSLYILEITAKTKPLWKNECHDPIYTNN